MDEHQLKPFLEALEGLEKDGFHGIVRVQEVTWPLAGTKSMEIIVELRKALDRT